MISHYLTKKFLENEMKIPALYYNPTVGILRLLLCTHIREDVGG